MRTFSPSFTYANAAREKSPRFVVAIFFDTDSLYLTSHPGIVNVPGVVIENVLTIKEAVSIRVVPDEGRTEIGVVNFDLLDLNGVVTDAFRAKLGAGFGLRGRTARLYCGHAGADFTAFEVFQTQVVASDSCDRGVYAIKCADITREQRKEILEPKLTRLTASIDAAATTFPVASTAVFEMVAHGSSYSDAPNAEVGYVLIDKEIIRYTGKTSDSFTGCTRGVLNTRAVPHTVDLNTPDDQKLKVEEYIYLELPGPKLLLALLTGDLYDQSASLPDHWHLGIAPTWVRTADFTGIGPDLWDLEDDSISFVARFGGLKKTDGKRFLEAEVYKLIGCFPIVYADGTLGIRRMNRVLADAPYSVVFNQDNLKSWSELTHDMEGVANDYSVEWNVVDGKATRVTRLIDSDSIAKHGAAKPRAMKFLGLFGSRHGDGTVKARLDALRDRYASPPALITVQALPSLNNCEVGDIARVQLPTVRDYMGAGSLDRSMEIQRTRINLATGDVQYELFGSTGLATTQPTTGAGGEGPDGENSAPDDFYDSEGTELSSVVDMTLVGDVWVVDPGSYDLPGAADMRDPAAIYYHLGDLTIPDTATFNITQNVQLRARGFATLNGDILGIGTGNAGVADTSGYGTTTQGIPGFGKSRAMNGVTAVIFGKNFRNFLNLEVGTTQGVQELPSYDVNVVAGSPPRLTGIPQDLRGTSGGPGGKIQESAYGTKTVLALGGTGGDGGAGLCIVSRGFAVGASGSVNLSGGDSATPDPAEAAARNVRPGAGAPGCPGAFLLVIDGSNLSLPDPSGGRVLAITGASGARMLNTLPTQSGGANPWSLDDDDEAGEGFLDPLTTDSNDLSVFAYRSIYLPAIGNPLEDQPAAVPAPDNLAATGIPNGILLTYELPDMDLFDGVEIYMASSNDRSGATKVAEVKATSYLQPLTPGTTRYFWVRNKRANLYSTWEPTGSTSGVSATST